MGFPNRLQTSVLFPDEQYSRYAPELLVFSDLLVSVFLHFRNPMDLLLR